MCIIERSRSAHTLGAEALEQGDAERAVETLSEGIKSASENDHHKVCSARGVHLRGGGGLVHPRGAG